MNLSIASIVLSNENSYKFSMSSPYYYGALIYAIPYGASYSSFDKLFFPFQPTIWMCISLMLVSVSIAIILLKTASRKVRSFVIGNRNNGPFCNLIAISLGITMPAYAVPHRNFARTILMILLAATLVLRNAYQGNLFNFLKTQKQRPPLFRVQDIWKADVDICVPETFHQLYVEEFPDISHRYKLPYTIC